MIVVKCLRNRASVEARRDRVCFQTGGVSGGCQNTKGGTLALPKDAKRFMNSMGSKSPIPEERLFVQFLYRVPGQTRLRGRKLRLRLLVRAACLPAEVTAVRTEDIVGEG